MGKHPTDGLSPGENFDGAPAHRRRGARVARAEVIRDSTFPGLMEFEIAGLAIRLDGSPVVTNCTANGSVLSFFRGPRRALSDADSEGFARLGSAHLVDAHLEASCVDLDFELGGVGARLDAALLAEALESIRRSGQAQF